MSSPKKQSSRKEEPISCIIEPTSSRGGLYLGNMDAASDLILLQQNDIQAILTMCPQNIPQSVKTKLVKHHQCLADDEDSYQIIQHFDETYRFIESARKLTNVLVHCQMGISRSATIVIAYLIKSNLIGAKEALDYVEKKRPIIFPNNGFLKQLGIFEKQFYNNLITESSSQRRQTSPSKQHTYNVFQTKYYDEDIKIKLANLRESNRPLSTFGYTYSQNKSSNIYQKRQENALFSNLYYKNYLE